MDVAQFFVKTIEERDRLSMRIKNKEKICFVIGSLKFGGAERVLSEIANYISDQGYEVYVVTFEKAKQEYKLQNKIKRIVLALPQNRIVKLVAGVSKLRRFLHKEKFPVCISFDILANCILPLAAPSGCKTIISERNAPIETKLSHMSKILRFLTYSKADKCVFQTLEAMEKSRYVPKEKGIVIPNPIKQDLPFRSSNNKEIVVAVGRLADQKNYPAMLRGFAEFIRKHKKYQLCIYGDGNRKDELIRFARNLKIQENVHFLGSVKDVHERIKKAQIFLMTSDYEGIPNALLEAMGIGLPVIAYDCPAGGVRLLLSKEKSGILLEDQSPGRIGSALCFLADHPEIRDEMGRRALYVRDEFSIDKIGAQWLSVILGI